MLLKSPKSKRHFNIRSLLECLILFVPASANLNITITKYYYNCLILLVTSQHVYKLNIIKQNLKPMTNKGTTNLIGFELIQRPAIEKGWSYELHSCINHLICTS